MKRWISASLFLLMLVVLYWLLAAPGFRETSLAIEWKIAAQLPIRMGILPYLSEEALRREMQPVAEYLGRNLGRPSRLIVAGDYEALGRLLDLHRIDIAWFSSNSLAQHDKGQWEVLCRPLRNGIAYNRGVIIARNDGKTHSLEDLRGCRFAFVDRNSGTGFVQPIKFFRSKGIDPLQFFGQVAFTGNHSYSLEGVLNGEFDAAALFDVFSGTASQSWVGPASLTLIAETGWILNDALVCRKDVDPVLKRRIIDLMVNMDRHPGGRELVEKLVHVRHWDRFVGVDTIPPPPVDTK